MTNDARVRLGITHWLAMLTLHPKITMNWEDAEALPIFLLDEQIDRGAAM